MGLKLSGADCQIVKREKDKSFDFLQNQVLDFSSQYGNDDSISYTAHNIVGRSAIAILTFSLFTRPFSTDLMFQHAGQASSPPMATSLRLLSCETMDPGGETAQVERSGVSL